MARASFAHRLIMVGVGCGSLVISIVSLLFGYHRMPTGNQKSRLGFEA